MSTLGSSQRTQTIYEPILNPAEYELVDTNAYSKTKPELLPVEGFDRSIGTSKLTPEKIRDTKFA